MSELRLRAHRLHWLESDGEIVALDEQSLLYLNTNASGTVLWQELDRGATREQLVQRMLTEFDVDEPTARADVDAFLADLRAKGLLEPSDA